MRPYAHRLPVSFPTRLLLPILTLALLAFPFPTHASSDRPTSSEYEAKAAFLLNFTKFIEWPAASGAEADDPFSICIIGNNPFGKILDRLVEGETAGGRRIEIQSIGRLPPNSCQVVFAGQSSNELSKVLSHLGRGILTVGEGDRFLRDGGMIAFVLDNRRVRFDINQSAAARAGLRISSKLLSVARFVEK